MTVCVFGVAVSALPGVPSVSSVSPEVLQGPGPYSVEVAGSGFSPVRDVFMDLTSFGVQRINVSVGGNTFWLCWCLAIYLRHSGMCARDSTYCSRRKFFSGWDNHGSLKIVGYPRGSHFGVA